ncbi:small kinetochore-associated protein isoform X2 [Kryptolebias marmoratus]|uniref:small kinetochore-associated protein isoform X2 n=1 Tax=Kryptolebias marmoratus TaxID=37003 RepID=UPI0007F8F84E|nr:small kinetochore-associated protein isoform X2 [Kryptolebias marmoratus]
MSLKIPRETKKNLHKHEAKDSAALPTAASAVHRPDGNLKAQKENIPRKNIAPKNHKGVSTRYGQQVELKEQNQHLMGVNEELQKNLSEAQQRVAELELQIGELQKENAEMKKSLHDCHVLLVSAKIDPVLGKTVGDAAQQNEDKRKEVMGVSTDLLRELKAFGEATSQQRARLKEIQTTMEDVAKARELMKQEKENVSQQAAEMEKALKEAEALLL